MVGHARVGSRAGAQVRHARSGPLAYGFEQAEVFDGAQQPERIAGPDEHCVVPRECQHRVGGAVGAGHSRAQGRENFAHGVGVCVWVAGGEGDEEHAAILAQQLADTVQRVFKKAQAGAERVGQQHGVDHNSLLGDGRDRWRESDGSVERGAGRRAIDFQAAGQSLRDVREIRRWGRTWDWCRSSPCSRCRAQAVRGGTPRSGDSVPDARRVRRSDPRPRWPGRICQSRGVCTGTAGSVMSAIMPGRPGRSSSARLRIGDGRPGQATIQARRRHLGITRVARRPESCGRDAPGRRTLPPGHPDRHP